MFTVGRSGLFSRRLAMFVDDDPGTERKTCIDCDYEFVITAAERTWFADKGLMLPKRCNACRRARLQEKRAAVFDGRRWSRE
jgi:hypothetical protein